ncbi:MAG: secondary thiamine-phosphate synthase enzyme YjbQ [Candidatus Marinimicrobia bacterium]|nr:secondary thiamine-phosphate synthase enzyme YjbQ [Candidatus Neomarinimicrobiota bacterium]
MISFNIRTSSRNTFLDITNDLQNILSEMGCKSGIMTVFTPHTTAGITINENADPDVQHDLKYKLNEMIPKDEAPYRHAEGNSDSHLKSSLFSPSLNLIYENGELVLGIWQAVYFSEFDGPRTRTVHVKIIEDNNS